MSFKCKNIGKRSFTCWDGKQLPPNSECIMSSSEVEYLRKGFSTEFIFAKIVDPPKSVKENVKVEVKANVQPEIKPEVKAEPKPVEEKLVDKMIDSVFEQAKKPVQSNQGKSHKHNRRG